jgi:hypothetical protein
MIIKTIGIKKRRLLKALFICFLASAAFGLLVFAYEVNSASIQSYKESEKYIDLIAAMSLNINDPNMLTSQDFEKVEDIRLRIYHLKSLKPLLKLKNLKRFMFFYIVESTDLDIDFGPLAKLKKLSELEISPMNVSYVPSPKKRNWYDGLISILHKIKPPAPKTSMFDLGMLRKLKQLESLTIQYDITFNYEALANLPNLKQLNLRGSYVSDKEFEELQKALPELEIKR